MKSITQHRVSLTYLALGIALSAFLLTATPTFAMARTTRDAGFWFSMPDLGTAATEGRLKEDTTPTYIHVTTITMKSCRVYVDAQVLFGWKNETVAGYATVYHTGKFAIHQNVYENHGQCNARLTAWANSGGGDLGGEWSPDSWGKYASINGD